MSSEKSTQYNITLPSSLVENLQQITTKFGIDTAEIMRRSLTLFNMAINSDEVILIKDNQKQKVILK